MSRGRLGIVTLALMLGTASVAPAHHPEKVEGCVSHTFSGEIERIEWRPPHVELFIRMDGDEGVTREVSWLAINQLGLAGVREDTLRVGDHVEVTAGTRPDVVIQRPMLLSRIVRDSDGWEWSQDPQGC